jgi:integral membrane protein (TIGR00529 family)
MNNLAVLFSVPALIKILLMFAALLFLNRLFPLYVCLPVISLVLGLWTELSLYSVLGIMAQEILSLPVLILSSAISLIVVFSDLLRRSGRLDSIVSSVKAVSPSPGVTLVLLPALIGLLPMPGGALFSAPMVDTALGKARVKPELKLMINYWFRHVMEFLWPLYPGFILAVSIFGISTWQFVVSEIPATIGALLAGVLFILPAVRVDGLGAGRFSPGGLLDFGSAFFPIAAVVGLMFVLQVCVDAGTRYWEISVQLPQQLSMAGALVAGIVYIAAADAMKWQDVKSALLNPGIVSIILMVFSIMAFKALLTESGTIDKMRLELQAYKIPEIAVIILLPLIAGLVTGLAVGFVGSSLPLVATLFPVGENILPYAILAYGFGIVGMMISPVHLCFLVTQEYFQTNAWDSYIFLWKPVLFMTGWIVLIFILYKVVF